MIETIKIENSFFPAKDESLEEFLEDSTVAIHFEDKQGIILYANAAELKMLDYTKEEYLGRQIADFHKDKTAIEFISAALSNGEKLNNKDACIICKDGSVKDVLISCNAAFNRGAFKYNCFFTRDITDLKRSEKLLKFLNKAGAEFATTHDTGEALDKIIELIVPNFADWFVINVLKDDGYAHLLKMAHVDPQKVIWAEKYRSMHPIDLQDPQVGSVGWSVRTGTPVLVPDITPEIIERGAKDDEQRKILKQLSIQSVMIIPMQIKGKATGVVSFMSCSPMNKYDENDFNFAKDFTNRIALTLENARLYEEVKKDIEERIEADKQKDEFISMASHELKTPVTSLKAYAQILQNLSEAEQNDVASGMLSKMNRQIDKLTGLIADLLDVIKIDRDEIVFDIQEFDFNELVKEIAEEMQLSNPTHKINLQLNPCDRLLGDRNRIGQVITNFVSNAIKYSPSANEIIVTSQCSDHKVKFSVRDFGIGIANDQQHKIFKKFFRAHSKDDNTYPGMGLGLSICAEIIRRHGGSIHFESNEGKGSVFNFEINGLDTGE